MSCIPSRRRPPRRSFTAWAPTRGASPSNAIEPRFLTSEPTIQPAPLPILAPDGQWVAFASAGKQEDIFLVRPDGANLHQLTDDTHKDRMPRWSPDGKQIAFFSDRSGKFQIWNMKPDGSALRRLTDDRTMPQGPVWSPDGARLVAFRQFTGDTLVMGPSKPWSEQNPQTLPPLGEGSRYFNPSSWSSDGRYLAGFGQGADGSFAGIVTYSFDSRKFQQLTEFGHVTRWLSDSRRLLFNHQGKLYLVDSRTKKVHEVLSVSPNEINPWHFGFTRDDRLIVVSLAVTEADIWLMSLE